MSPPPNEVFTLFSFIGFVLCAIPLYWHLEAWNAGTCLYMIWTGLGCLMQCVNSIIWNKNIVNRVPVYCDICTTHIQAALNVALPVSSLCINRQLYRVARMKTAGTSDVEKRRNLIYDLLIGIGIPVLQIIAVYVVSEDRYNILEDFGPLLPFWNTALSYVLFSAWPVAIGTVSLFYCIMAIHAFYKHRRNHMQLLPSANRGRYLRLMAISFTEILGTVPLATYYIASDAKTGVVPWKGWAVMHSHHSEVDQIAGFIWKNDPVVGRNLEMFRWSLVLCAFIFFTLFGFAGEAREHYHRLYKLLARRIGKSSSMSTPQGTPLATTPSVSYVTRNGGVTSRTMVQMGRGMDSLSMFNSTGSSLKDDSVILQDSDSDSVSFYTAKSSDETEMETRCRLVPQPGLLQTGRPISVQFLSTPPPAFLPKVRPASMPSAPPPGFLSTLYPASILHHLPDPTNSAMPVHASSSVETV